MIRTIKQAYLHCWGLGREIILLVIYCFFAFVQIMIAVTEKDVTMFGFWIFCFMSIYVCAIACSISANVALNKFTRSVRGTKALQTHGFVLMTLINMMTAVIIMIIGLSISLLAVSQNYYLISDCLIGFGVAILIVLPLITVTYRFPALLYIAYMTMCFSSFWISRVIDWLDTLDEMTEIDSKGLGVSIPIAVMIFVVGVSVGTLAAIGISRLTYKKGGKSFYFSKGLSNTSCITNQ